MSTLALDVGPTPSRSAPPLAPPASSHDGVRPIGQILLERRLIDPQGLADTIAREV